MDPFGFQQGLQMYSKGCRCTAGAAGMCSRGCRHVQQGLQMYSKGCRCTARAADVQQGLHVSSQNMKNRQFCTVFVRFGSCLAVAVHGWLWLAMLGCGCTSTAGAADVQQRLHMYSRGCRCTAGAAHLDPIWTHMNYIWIPFGSKWMPYGAI